MRRTSVWSIGKCQLKNRCQFFAVAAQMMRRVLVDHARARDADKRGGLAKRVTLNTAVLGAQRNTIDLADLDGTMNRLAQFDSRKAQVVELRVFGGLEVQEVAEIMDVAEITIRRD